MLEPLSPSMEIWRGLLYGQRSMMLRLSAELKRDHDLSAAQYETLLTLWESPDHELTASSLAQSLLYSSGSASNLFRRLEERGLVARAEADHDRRIVLVRLTPTGRDLVSRATAEHLEALQSAFTPLVSPDEEAHLLAFVRRLCAAEGVTSQHPA